MAPMMTAVELTFRPSEAIKVAKMSTNLWVLIFATFEHPQVGAFELYTAPDGVDGHLLVLFAAFQVEVFVEKLLQLRFFKRICRHS